MEIGITGFHPGVGRFAHAHSGYLDFLIAFGLVGSVLGIVLVITFVRKVVQGWSLRGSWEARSAPWIYGAALAVMGLTESAMIQNSTGWLFSGMLVGAFVIADPYSRRGVDPETEAVRIASCSDSAREDRG
jgi:O-antigen ligase